MSSPSGRGHGWGAPHRGRNGVGPSGPPEADPPVCFFWEIEGRWTPPSPSRAAIQGRPCMRSSFLDRGPRGPRVGGLRLSDAAHSDIRVLPQPTRCLGAPTWGVHSAPGRGDLRPGGRGSKKREVVLSLTRAAGTRFAWTPLWCSRRYCYSADRLLHLLLLAVLPGAHPLGIQGGNTRIRHHDSERHTTS